ncbi:deaminated glutathione amidase [Planosporangium thailandense]|uniref:Deaminated glutathione amidase n=2 Tax=Planosporangium thailandense TaxID=765197 RepID=A0ABX0Y5Y0_9ACTN|nr:deaminated glutathione amidase [Planosporangium thailandense]
MRVAVGQFAASTEWQENLRTCAQYIDAAEAGGADLLVLPEGVLARFTDDFTRIRTAAQPLDGPFVTGLRELTRDKRVTVVVGVHEPAPDGRAYNTLVVLVAGELVTRYRKLHLYDAFSSQESANVVPADDVPALFTCAGLRVGLMTCYDVRFPELARLLTVAGADLLVLPAAWVRGPLKEQHWQLMVSARALENTVYVAASGECGPRNIGRSLVVDPLGVTVAAAAEGPALIWAEVDPARLADARRQLPVLDNRRFSVDPVARPVPGVPAPASLA